MPQEVEGVTSGEGAWVAAKSGHFCFLSSIVLK